MSDTPRAFMDQFPTPTMTGGWQAVEPLKSAPMFMELNPRTGVAIAPIYDVGNGATVETDTIAGVFPDSGCVYEIDDIVVSCVDEALNEATATLKVGLYGNQVALATGVATAKNDDNYFLDVTLATIAVGAEKSVSAGDMAWASTADSDAKRCIQGGTYLRVTTTAATTGGKTGMVRLFVRYHLAGKYGVKYPRVSNETAA